MREGALYRQKARDFEQRENWKRAIEAYELAMEADRKARREIDPALYNRVGDLYRRIGDVGKAVYHYEKAADGHLSAGFYNNAIALCNKILRNKPNQHSAYLKLGKIGAAKGFLSDARRHFLEYAERMQRANKLDEAFSALIEFANVSSDPEIRLMVAEQLLGHGRQAAAVEELRLAWRDLRLQGREADSAQVRDQILQLAPHRDPEVEPPEESTVAATDSVGIMDLPEILPYDEPEDEPAPPPKKEPLSTESESADADAAAEEPEPVAAESVVAEPVAEVPLEQQGLGAYGMIQLDSETGDLVETEREAYESAPAAGSIELMPTTLEDPDRLAEMAHGETAAVEGLEDLPADLVGTEAGTDVDEAFLDEEDLEIVPTEFSDAGRFEEPSDEVSPGEVGILPTMLEEPEEWAEAEDAELAGDEGLEIVPTTLAAEEEVDVAEGAEPPAEEYGLVTPELPELPLDEPVIGEEPVAVDDPIAVDQPVEEARPPVDYGPAVETEPELEAAPADRLRELESQLEAVGRTPDILVELSEAFLEAGDREAAIRHLGEAAQAFEDQGRFEDARRVIDELLQVDLNDVRAYQKRVELALMAKDRSALIPAYLDLADCLDRTDASNKAMIVYARVLELDPDNHRATAALDLLGGAVTGAQPAAVSKTPKSQEKDQYVDLRSLVVEEKKAEAKSTRFRVSAADPQSEADVNFAEMLKQFKSMVSEAIEKEDSASHYDLGCAYRDMGLLDEAIAEFQIAARNPEFRLRAIEMLGACFAEKGDHRIALKVLSRAAQAPGHKDEELIEIYYAMGRAHEELGEKVSAVEWYERVMGCDVRFKDASKRVSSLRQ
jgi:tetratricopeptide (TPR) repeat protein